MSKSILIIDDEEDVRAITQMGLEMATNWKIIIASSGEEGFNLAKTQQPELILLDLMMPDWDGKETLKQLKANHNTAHIPVILMTAKTRSAIANELATWDIIGIITKPFRPLQLSAEITKILNNT